MSMTKSEERKLKMFGLTILGVFLFLFLIVTISVGSYIGAKNKGVTYTTNIEKFHQQSQNVLSSYTLKIREMAQVPEMYTEALRKHVESTFSGRYGTDGSKAMMQWITENNIEFDSSMYKNLQIEMVAGRNSFELSQSKKLDICANFKRELGYFWGGMWLNFAGYHHVPERECTIILDVNTSSQFESGIATEIKLF